MAGSKSYKVFAYNPSRNPITYATLYGDLAVADPNYDWSGDPGPGGVKWWAGPDVGTVARWIVAIPVPAGNQPTPIAGVYASVGFNGVNASDANFISMVNSMTGHSFTTTTQAYNEVIANGWYTNFPQPTTTTTTIDQGGGAG